MGVGAASCSSKSIVLVAALDSVGDVDVMSEVSDGTPGSAVVYSAMVSAEAAATAVLDLAMWCVAVDFAIVRGGSASVLGKRAVLVWTRAWY